MKRILLALLVCAAIAAAFAYGFLVPRPSHINPAAGQKAPQPKAEEQSTTGIPASDRLLTAGTQEIPVIMYHDVVPKKDVWFDLTTREFERQMQAIKDAGGTVVPLSDVVEHLKTGKPLPKKAIALTFDDNTLGIYENAWPILREFGYHSTQFVHTAKVGVKTGKDHCTWEQLKEMQESGLVEIGSHTQDHPADLRKLTPEDVKAQLVESKATIEAQMGKPCRYFAYTEGNGDESTAQIVAEAGYEAAWGEVRAWEASPCDRLFLARFAPFRLDDVLNRWKQAKSPATLAAESPLKGAPETKLLKVERAGVSMEVTNATWSGILPDVNHPEDFGGITVPNMLFNLTLAGSAPSENQWKWLGRPFVIAGVDRAYIIPYQPWMGVSPDSIKVLWPETSFAVVGLEQMLHDGKPVESRNWNGGRRQVSFIGWKAEGTPVLGQTKGYCGREALVEALQGIGMKEAVLLER